MSRTTRTRAGAAALGAATALVLATAAPVHAEMHDHGHDHVEADEPASFTSAFTVMAMPDNVVDADGEPAPGPDGASATFDFRINSDEEVICYDIVLRGADPTYESPADTATHIHEAEPGVQGPPRIVFPDPTENGDGTLSSSGCMQGPFTTGLVPDGADADSGEGFTLAEIEADPAGYYSDIHTVDNPAGIVRGQLTPVPVGGVDTGAGATTAVGTGTSVVPLALGGLVLAGIAGFALRRLLRVEVG